VTYFTDEQVNVLLKRIHPNRVLQRAGMSYVEGYDIKAELNRVLGFGRWSAEILDQSLICETATKTNASKDAWYVVYKTSLRLTVCAPDGTPVARYEESHVGESTHPVRGEAHGNALTNSWTYALKRCASNLGDQFGLSLYGKGSMDALVRWTLVRPAAGEQGTKVNDDDVPQVTAEAAEVHGTGEGTPPPGDDDTASEKASPVKAASRPEPVRPAAEAKAPPAAVTDWDWMSRLTDDLIPGASTRGELAGFWADIAAHVADGTCTDENAGQVRSHILERAAELGLEMKAA
jgi:Rad52/22 family double-strand break repair protein